MILRDGGDADANGRLLGNRMDGVWAVDIGKGEAQVLLHGTQAEVFGVEVNQRAQQSGGTLLSEVPTAPETLFLHPAPKRA